MRIRKIAIPVVFLAMVSAIAPAARIATGAQMAAVKPPANEHQADPAVSVPELSPDRSTRPAGIPAADLVSQAATAEEAAREWIALIAGRPGMEDWRDGETKMAPLGPGRHGWLALVRRDGQTVGHLIVSATPEGGFRLTGFGRGEPPTELP